MSSLVQADIFFFVTTIAVILFTLVLVIGMIFVIVFVARLNRIAQEIEDQIQVMKQDYRDLQEAVIDRLERLSNTVVGGFLMTAIAAFARWYAERSGKSTKKTRTRKKSARKSTSTKKS